MANKEISLAIIKQDQAEAEKAETQIFSELISKTISKTEEVFGRLDAYSFINEIDKGEFTYYRSFYREALVAMDKKIKNGKLYPQNLEDFPEIVRFPDYIINASLFIGSFDPFQMTHIASALHYLASAHAKASIVFVVPEGHRNPAKPTKSDYRYRYELLSMQLKGIFEPFIVPLDIGEDADTIEIVKRFIGLFPGARVEVCHLLGSDSLDILSRMLPEDLRIWNKEAQKMGSNFIYDAYIIERDGYASQKSQLEAVYGAGAQIHVDTGSIGTPSSSDFREKQAFSIVFPTSSVINHIEVLFRYNLNKPWSVCGLADNPNDYPR